MARRKLIGYLTLSWVPHALVYVVAPNVLASSPNGTTSRSASGRGSSLPHR